MTVRRLLFEPSELKLLRRIIIGLSCQCIQQLTGKSTLTTLSASATRSQSQGSLWSSATSHTSHTTRLD
jgi:hypothetical protein